MLCLHTTKKKQPIFQTTDHRRRIRHKIINFLHLSWPRRPPHLAHPINLEIADIRRDKWRVRASGEVSITPLHLRASSPNISIISREGIQSNLITRASAIFYGIIPRSNSETCLMYLRLRYYLLFSVNFAFGGFFLVINASRLCTSDEINR